MKVENFSAAVEFYSKAITLNPQNAVYYCNRSARSGCHVMPCRHGFLHAASESEDTYVTLTCLSCLSCRAAAYSKLGNYAGAVQDCEQAISIDPNYSKAYGRMG